MIYAISMPIPFQFPTICTNLSCCYVLIYQVVSLAYLFAHPTIYPVVHLFVHPNHFLREACDVFVSHFCSLFYRIPYQWCVPIGMLVDQVVYSCFFFVCPYSGSLSMSWHRTALVRSHARLLAAYRIRMSYWCKMVWPIGGRYIGYLSHLAIQCIFCCVPFCNRTWKGMLNTMYIDLVACICSTNIRPLLVSLNVKK